MYRRDQTGPWPNLDLGADRNQRTDAHAETAPDAAFDVLFDTANLGGNLKAYVNNTWYKAIAPTPGAGYFTSFGVLLNSFDAIPEYDDQSLLVDISISARMFVDEYQGKGPALLPWIGFLDSGKTPQDGWSAANNVVTHWHAIPCSTTDDCLDLQTHVIIRDILSGAIPDDQKLGIGFSLIGSGDSVNAIHYTISAEYGLAPYSILKRY